MMLKIYGDSISGNCLKVRWLLDKLGINHAWIETDIMTGGSRTPDFLALNPAGQVPLAVLADGRPLAQSNAILIHFGEGTDWIPANSYERARMLEWMFWEQYSHEPYIAVARFQRLYLRRSGDEVEPRIMERGRAALERMEAALDGRGWLVGNGASLADIALVAYTRMAGDGGFDLEGYPAIRAWITRVEAALGIGPYESESASSSSVPAASRA